MAPAFFSPEQNPHWRPWAQHSTIWTVLWLSLALILCHCLSIKFLSPKHSVVDFSAEPHMWHTCALLSHPLFIFMHNLLGLWDVCWLIANTLWEWGEGVFSQPDSHAVCTWANTQSRSPTSACYWDPPGAGALWSLSPDAKWRSTQGLFWRYVLPSQPSSAASS